MANYETLKATIAQYIKENHANDISGNLLQQQLLAMVNSLGVGYQYVGMATPSTNPGTPDQNVFYLASTAGTYANFGGLVLADGEIAILKYNGAWSKDSTGAATQESVNQLGQKIGLLSFVGNNDAFAWGTNYVPVQNQSSYVLELDTTEPDMSGVTSIYSRLSYRLLDENMSQLQDIRLAYMEDALEKKYYIFVNNPDAKYLQIGGRAAFGYKFGAKLYDWALSDVKFYYRNLPNIDTINGTIKFDNSLIAFYNNEMFIYSGSGIDLTIQLHPATSPTTAWKLMYNVLTHQIACFPYNDYYSGWVLVGFFYLASGSSYSGFYSAILPFDYTIDGILPLPKQFKGIIPASVGVPNIDTHNHVLNLRNCIIMYGNVSDEMATIWPNNPEKYTNISYKDPGNPTSATRIVYNINTKEFYARAYSYPISDDELVIGGVRSVYGSAQFVSAEFPFEYTVDEQPIDINYYKKLFGGYIDGLDYTGAPIKISCNKYLRNLFKELSESFVHQSMAIYDDYCILMTYNYNTSGESEAGKVTAHIYSISTGEKLASLDVPYNGYTIPHCNTAVFGNEFANENSIAPLLYVSQWNGERNCLIYDITKTNNVYAISLVQVIGTNQISTEKEGAGMRDWVVDTDKNKVYSIAYYLNSDSVPTGNKTKIMAFNLPKLSDGNIVFTESDILDYYEQPFWQFFQDKCYNNGKILIASGMQDYQDSTNIRVLDLMTKQVVTIIPLGKTYNSEPEGLNTYQDKLLLTYGWGYLFEIIAN